MSELEKIRKEEMEEIDLEAQILGYEARKQEITKDIDFASMKSGKSEWWKAENEKALGNGLVEFEGEIFYRTKF